MDTQQIKSFVKDKGFTHIINCAAYNNVDKAEKEKELCHRLNTIAPTILAEIACKIDAVYVTYSSDFVFDGNKTNPYIETDKVTPLSVYGKTKGIIFRVFANQENLIQVFQITYKNII